MASTPADDRVPGQVGHIQRRNSKHLRLAQDIIKSAKNEAKKEIDAKKQRLEDEEQKAQVTGDGNTFFKLNRDIRNVIYEYLFEGGTIDFWMREGFQRSGQMLRVSKAIYYETRPILYQQNFFRFCYDLTEVGKFYEKPKEIGYAGCVEFLRMIGRNVCMYFSSYKSYSLSLRSHDLFRSHRRLISLQATSALSNLGCRLAIITATTRMSSPCSGCFVTPTCALSLSASSATHR